MFTLPAITVGEYEIFTSGSLVCAAEKPILITPVVAGLGQPYTIEVQFYTNPLMAPSINLAVRGTGGVRITATNLDNPAGACTSVPIDIGTHMGRKFYMMFASYIIGQAAAAPPVRVFFYTLYLGERA